MGRVLVSYQCHIGMYEARFMLKPKKGHSLLCSNSKETDKISWACGHTCTHGPCSIWLVIALSRSIMVSLGPRIGIAVSGSHSSACPRAFFFFWLFPVLSVEHGRTTGAMRMVLSLGGEESPREWGLASIFSLTKLCASVRQSAWEQDCALQAVHSWRAVVCSVASGQAAPLHVF